MSDRDDVTRQTHAARGNYAIQAAQRIKHLERELAEHQATIARIEALIDYANNNRQPNRFPIVYVADLQEAIHPPTPGGAA